MTSSPSRYRAILFDVDGTLVDSNAAHAHAWVEAFAEAGIKVDPAPVRQATIKPFLDAANLVATLTAQASRWWRPAPHRRTN